MSAILFNYYVQGHQEISETLKYGQCLPEEIPFARSIEARVCALFWTVMSAGATVIYIIPAWFLMNIEVIGIFGNLGTEGVGYRLAKVNLLFFVVIISSLATLVGGVFLPELVYGFEAESLANCCLKMVYAEEINENLALHNYYSFQYEFLPDGGEKFMNNWRNTISSHLKLDFNRSSGIDYSLHEVFHEALQEHYTDEEIICCIKRCNLTAMYPDRTFRDDHETIISFLRGVVAEARAELIQEGVYNHEELLRGVGDRDVQERVLFSLVKNAHREGAAFCWNLKDENNTQVSISPGSHSSILYGVLQRLYPLIHNPDFTPDKEESLKMRLIRKHALEPPAEEIRNASPDVVKIRMLFLKALDALHDIFTELGMNWAIG